MTLEGKTIAETATTLSQFILPSQANPIGTAHGGELLKMMDNCAAVCAMKHARSVSVTAGVDDVNFHAPVYVGNFATCNAHITYVSNRSMEVSVNIYAEDLLAGTKQCCMTAYFIFVALDENLQPKQVAAMILQNEAERKNFAEGKARMEERKKKPRVCWISLY